MCYNRPLQTRWLSIATLCILFANCSDDSDTFIAPSNDNADVGNVAADQGQGQPDPDVSTPDQDASVPPDVSVTPPDLSIPDVQVGPPDPADSEFGLQARPANTECVAPRDRPPVSEIGVRLQTIVSGLQFPIDAHQNSDGSRWYVAQRRGQIVYFETNNLGDPEQVPTEVFGDISGSVEVIIDQNVADEGGLLSFAFHPNFPQVGFVYLFYTGQSGNGGVELRVSRFAATPDSMDVGSEQRILTVVKPEGSRTHNGGKIAFDPTSSNRHLLYVAIGDGDGPDGQPSQELNSHFGKLLRYEVGQDGSVSPASDNPFVGREGALPEIYTIGLRNPWRWSFDRQTGDIWIGDVGDSAFEEVNRMLAPHGGENFGWPIKEGNECSQAGCDQSGLTDPLVQYIYEQEGISIVGGFVYRGSAIPGLIGNYLHSDTGNQELRRIYEDPTTGDFVSELINPGSGTIVSFAEDVAGELYLIDLISGELKQILPNAQEPNDNFPSRLSQWSGCVNPSNPREISASMIPYDIAAPLWSDGASKDRYFAIPDGTNITVNEDGEFLFPPGSLLIKNFFVNDRIVETRLFMLHPDESAAIGGVWAGYSYAWNEDQTDAELLRSSDRRTFGDGVQWSYPTRGQCMACHTTVANFVLGLETAQLNFPFTYPSTGNRANQLATIGHIQLLNNPPDPGSSPSLATYFDNTRSAADRARAYLHSNCSSCHRPGGLARANINLLYTASREDLGMCDTPPEEGNLDIPNAQLIAPGSVERSILYQRMNRRDSSQMPPLATDFADPTGLNLVSNWILGDACQ